MRNYFIIFLAPLLVGVSPLPPTPTEKGSDAYTAGKFDEAVEAYEKAAADNPDKAEAHYNLGGAYYKKGEYDKALREYDEALKIDPKMADAYYNKGDALYRMGKYEDALKAFRQAESLKKGDADTNHNIEVTVKKVKQEKEKQKEGMQNKQANGQNGKEQGKGQGKQEQGGGQGEAGQGPMSDKNPGGQGMSNEEAQALLDRQSREEKNLRNYFRPGRKDEDVSREAQIEQMLRGFGLAGPGARPARPGAPYIKKDW